MSVQYLSILVTPSIYRSSRLANLVVAVQMGLAAKSNLAPGIAYWRSVDSRRLISEARVLTKDGQRGLVEGSFKLGYSVGGQLDNFLLMNQRCPSYGITFHPHIGS